MNDDAQIKTSELYNRLSKVDFKKAEKVIEIANIFNIKFSTLKKICAILNTDFLPFPYGKIYNSYKLESFLWTLNNVSDEDKVFIRGLEIGKSLENPDVNKAMYRYFTSKVEHKNIVYYYSYAVYFGYKNYSKLLLKYIERCFLVVAETHSFLELDHEILAGILSSSKLCIDSKIEVLNAADAWISHDTEKRGKFALDLLNKVRLSLLSSAALKYILDSGNCFTKNKKCFQLLSALIKEKNNKKV